MSTEDLQSLESVTDATAEKLLLAGISTVEALAAATMKKLVQCGLAKSTAQKILEEARERCNETFGFVTGEDLVRQYERRQYLTTGTTALDGILGGTGFETQKVYEIYGPEGTGKSTLLHQLVCTAFLPPDKGGLGAGAIFIDTEGTFSIKKVQQMAPRFGIDPAEISRNVIKAGPPTSDNLLYLCEVQLEKLAHESGARLFCLDSIATHFRAEYGAERQGFPERQQKANKVIHALKRVAQQSNGVAIMTNQVTANVSGFGRPFTHSMGYVVGHEAQVRILVQVKNKEAGLREFRIDKALDLPPADCILQVSEIGFTDPPAEKKRKKGKDEEPEKKGDKADEKKEDAKESKEGSGTKFTHFTTTTEEPKAETADPPAEEKPEAPSEKTEKPKRTTAKK